MKLYRFEKYDWKVKNDYLSLTRSNKLTKYTNIINENAFGPRIDPDKVPPATITTILAFIQPKYGTLISRSIMQHIISHMYVVETSFYKQYNFHDSRKIGTI